MYVYYHEICGLVPFGAQQRLGSLIRPNRASSWKNTLNDLPADTALFCAFSRIDGQFF